MTRLTRSPSVALLDGQAPPRVLHAPASRANSWEDVSDLLASFGVVLDEWQELVLQSSLGERTDGRWVTPQVAVSTPRQNGKSQLIVARALAGALLFGERLIVISAHQQDTAREVFTRLLDLIDGNSALAERVEKVMSALNREFIKFGNGAEIRFKARSAGGGRGFSCDCLLLDEAQILGASAWAAILPTMSARPNPQVWLLGTPPTPQDDGEVFGRIRDAGVEGKTARLAYLEWSAERTDDFDDPATWAKANPSFGTRVNPEIVAGERASMSDEQFAMERLGIWMSEAAGTPVIPAATWGRLKTETPPTEGRVSYGVKFSVDGSVVALGVARRPDEGPVHLEVIEHRSMASGTTWLADWLAARWRDAAAIVVDGKSGAGDLVNKLRAAGVPETVIVVPTTGDVIAAHSMILTAVGESTVTHFDQPALNDSVAGAKKREIGKAGGWGFAPIGAADVAPIESVTLALFGAMTSKRRPGRKTRMAVMT